MAKLESSFMGKEVGWQPSSLLFHTAHSAWVTSSAPVASITISRRMTAKFLPTTQNSAPSSRSMYQLPSQHFSLGSNQIGLHSAMSNRDRKYSDLNKSFFFSYEYLKIWRYTDLDWHGDISQAPVSLQVTVLLSLGCVSRPYGPWWLELHSSRSHSRQQGSERQDEE